MHKPKSVPENETHTILCDFEIQIDRLITARQPDIVIMNKKKKKRKEKKRKKKETLLTCGLCCPG